MQETLGRYGDIARCVEQARAHHVALSAVTRESLPAGSGTAELVDQFLAVVAARSVAYFRDFAEQAWRAFPSYRDRQRGRGHKTRAGQRHAHALPVDIPWLRRAYRDRCVYCAERSAHIDHLWPISANGDDAPWNLAPSCGTCNLSKGAKPLSEWLPRHLAELDDARRTAVVDLWAGLLG